MVLRPARMVRLAILAPHSRARDVIEVLHAARAFHLEEYKEGKHAELRLGAPLSEGSKASERLVRIRALIRHLGLEAPAEGVRPLPSATVRAKLDHALPALENNVGSAVEAHDRVARELEARIEERRALEPLADLGVALEDLAGYDSIKVLVGQADPDVSTAIRAVSPRASVVRGSQAQALFIPASDAERASEVLGSAGFKPTEVPAGRGSVGDNLARVENDIRSLGGKLDAARAALDALRRDHGELLLAAEEDLAIEVEKAEAPLAFGHSERAFMVDAWVPEDKEAEVRSRLEKAAAGAVHIEVIDRGLRTEHHRTAEPPTRYAHPKPVRPFSFFLDLFSTPKYGELDPTLVLFIVFPLFFGFMIGDLGYGLLIAALGLFLIRRLGSRSEAARGLGAALLIGGLWATLFGLVVFHDAFGVPFVSHEDPEALAWFGLHETLEGGASHHALSGVFVGEGSWLAHPPIEKLASEEAETFADKTHPLGVKSMLAISVMAAFVHLLLGFVFGLINDWHHSKKHAVAKLGWISVLVGMFVLVLVMSAQGAPNAVSYWLMGLLGQPAVLTGSVPFIVAGAVVLIATEGAMGAMEILSLLSHTISYTRLAGIAVAKAAMAFAFNGLFLRDMVINGSGALIVVGFVLFILAQMLLFVLGILSAGIQAIRLNYVEFFLKFYKGGGVSFSPFGRERQYTLANPKAPT